MIASTSLRPGMIFEYNDKKYQVLKQEHIKKGRGQAINKVKSKDLLSGAIIELTFTNEQSVEEADVVKKSAQFLYSDNKNGYFMLMEDFSQFEIPVNQVEEFLGFLKEGTKIVALFIDGRPINIDIPKTVSLEVTFTEPAVGGNTATGAVKIAELDTGLKIKVPLFIKKGDNVKINSQTSEYVSRDK